MDFEKIKNFLLEKKNYILIILALVFGGIFFLKNQGQQPVDNGNLVTQDGQSASHSGSSTVTSSAQNSGFTQSSQSISSQNTVTCDIAGAVKEPGVYTLKNGARLDNLLKAAGGSKKNANLKQINRALILKDQDQIYIPYKGEKVENAVSAPSVSASPSSTQTSTSSSTNSQEGEKIHINSASVQDFQKLSGIGEKKAEQIVNYREQNGGFKSIDEITKVSGIGEKTFEKFKDQLEL